MGSHQFDKQIKDKLQFHHAEVDPILWDKIEAHLPKKNNNRLLPLFWIASFVIVLTALTLGYYTRQTKNIASKLNTVASNSLAKSKTLTQPENSTFEKELSENIEVRKTPNLKTISEEKTGNEEKKSILRSENMIVSSFIAQNAAQIPAVSTASIIMEPSDISNSSKNIIGVGNLYTYVKPAVISDVNSFYSTASKKITNKDHCLEDFSSRGRGMTLEAFYGNDFPIRHMKAKTESFATLVNERKNTETPLYSYSLGARLGFNISDELKIYTGAFYSQVNEKFEYVDPESSQTKVVKTTLYIKDGQGNIKDSTFTFDTIYIPGTLIYKIKNQYTTVDLPFLIGFHAFKGSKIDVHLNVGILANLVFQKSGMALVNENYSVRSFKDSGDNTFNNSLGISSYVGAQFSYKWKPNIHFFIEPNVRIQHRGLTTKDYPISHKYTTISFFTGAAYNF